IAAAILVQAIHYAVYFALSPQLAVRGRMPPVALWLPLIMVIALGALHRDGWLIARLPFLLVGGLIAAIVNAPVRARAPGQTVWRHLCDAIFACWARYSLDRLLLRVVLFLLVPHAVQLISWLVLSAVDPRNALVRSSEIAAGVAVIWGWLGFVMRGP